MNPIINQILDAKREFVRLYPDRTPRIMVNPRVLYDLCRQVDSLGFHVAGTNYPKEGWYCLGMTAVQDDEVKEWEVF